MVVLVHGIGMSHRYLRGLHRELSRSATVVSIDLPGHGGMPMPGRDVDIDTMAGALTVVLRRLRLGTATLVGHSMGAQWVVEAARRDPAVAGRVVLVGPVADDRHRNVRAQAVALAADTLREAPRVNAMVFSDYLRCGPRWYVTQLRHMIAYPLEERVRCLQMPVVVVRGSRDPIAGPEWCRRLAAAAPHGAVVEIAGGAHVVHEHSPAATATVILDTGVRHAEREGPIRRRGL